MKIMSMVFPQILQGKCTILFPKGMCSHKSGSAVRIFFRFCTVNGFKRYIKNRLMVFLKKTFLEVFAPFLAPKWHVPELWTHSDFLFEFRTMKRAKRSKLCLWFFCKKFFRVTNAPFWAPKWHAVRTMDPLKGLF